MEYTNIERIIAKIDNDFNPNNSDWIPRVGAWVHDVLSQLQITPTETKEERINVHSNIARFCTDLPNDIKVYDSNHCIVKLYNANKNNNCSGGCPPSKGGMEKTPYTINAECTGFKQGVENIAITKPSITYPHGVEVIEPDISNSCADKTYIRVDSKTIELLYNGEKFITVIYKSPKTTYSDVFNCELPIVPNNGKLIEAISYYCIYKMLCRGYKHPVFNLGASQYGTNPYHIWITTKDEAARSVINDGVDEDLSNLWQSAFFISTFGK